MTPQHLLILGGYLSAVALAVIAAWRRAPLKRWVGFSSCLVGLATYETYMSFVWEPSVHAPIRLDMFAEIPLLITFTVLGFVFVVWRRN